MTDEKKKEEQWWRKYTKEYAEEEPIEPSARKRKEEEIEKEEKVLVPKEYYDPLREMSTLQKEMENIFKSFFGRSLFGGNFFGKDMFKVPELPRLIKMEGGVFRKPMSQVRETNREVLVRVELPGVRKEDIKIKVERLNLIIDAQQRSTSEDRREGFFGVSTSYKGFRHIVRLPCEVDKAQSRATYDAGILHVILPKKRTGDEGPRDIDLE